ncbi:Uncharacterized membrane protein [Hydrocarboniphaga daqingensis]|uniref:Uncharacterized membrane protein n=1 Tax=Hydrocarboniphaga daqingensis TaxID=490188 RepID=A0A1M5R8Z5_9GAMM|nr:DUF502 domain-containing protein [Hydrocarboniphaga daqingensis]SHH22837.1 Uncharacterized membrane protein [Hydrocarboniphaga daqingensis]
MKFDWSRIDWRAAGARRGSLRLSGRKLSRTFFTGLLAVLPIMVTLAVVMWLIGVADTFFGSFVRWFAPGTASLPGMGLLMSLLVIFVVGLLMQAVFFREFIKWTEEQLERVPLIKTVYSAVRDLTGFFSKKDDSRFGRVVMVAMPNLPFRLLGFITVEDLTAFGLAQDHDTVAVYLPMSYQIGGYTVLIARQHLVEVDMSFEDAMRFLITAGMSRGADAAPGAAVVMPPGVTPPG